MGSGEPPSREGKHQKGNMVCVDGVGEYSLALPVCCRRRFFLIAGTPCLLIRYVRTKCETFPVQKACEFGSFTVLVVHVSGVVANVVRGKGINGDCLRDFG